MNGENYNNSEMLSYWIFKHFLIAELVVFVRDACGEVARKSSNVIGGNQEFPDHVPPFLSCVQLVISNRCLDFSFLCWKPRLKICKQDTMLGLHWHVVREDRNFLKDEIPCLG